MTDEDVDDIHACQSGADVCRYLPFEPRTRDCKRLGMRREAHFVEELWFKGAWGDTAIYAILDREWAARAK